MYFKKIILFVIAGLVLLTSCKKEKSPVVTRVGKFGITASQIEVQIPEGFRGDPRVKEEIKRQYINEVLLYNAAKSEGLMDDDELKAQLKVTEVKVVAQYYLSEKMKSLNLSETELQQEFERSRQYFSKKYDLVVLYFADKSKVSQYRSILMNPYPVIQSEVNKLGSPDVQVAPISENLGVIYYSYGDELFKIINNLKVGEISDPIPVSSQYYVLIKLIKISPDNVSDEEVKEFLRRSILTYKQTIMRDSILTALQNKYKVVEVSGR
ncbi:MAG: peptidylprolyl isomerase [candidate division WOR-3 bacterium]